MAFCESNSYPQKENLEKEQQNEFLRSQSIFNSQQFLSMRVHKFSIVVTSSFKMQLVLYIVLNWILKNSIIF
jgi:predicted ester cyclase